MLSYRVRHYENSSMKHWGVGWGGGRGGVFLVFSEVLEMSSEVAGPGPTHGRSNLSGLAWDLLLVPSRPMPDACYPLVLFVVCGGVSSRGAVLAVPSVVPVLVLQDSTLYRQVV